MCVFSKVGRYHVKRICKAEMLYDVLLMDPVGRLEYALTGNAVGDWYYVVIVGKALWIGKMCIRI